MTGLETFAAFYEAHRTEVYRCVVVTLRDRDLALEAVDEAFTRAAERWSQVAAMQRPAGWVFRVAVNWATSWRRKWARRPVRPVEELDGVHHDVLPDDEVVQLLARLPMAQRQMLVLRFVMGYSVAETAAVLDVAEGTVKSGVHRARQQLRDGLEVADGRP